MTRHGTATEKKRRIGWQEIEIEDGSGLAREKYIDMISGEGVKKKMACMGIKIQEAQVRVLGSEEAEKGKPEGNEDEANRQIWDIVKRCGESKENKGSKEQRRPAKETSEEGEDEGKENDGQMDEDEDDLDNKYMAKRKPCIKRFPPLKECRCAELYSSKYLW